MTSNRELTVDFGATPDLESASIYEMLARIGDRTRPLLLPAIQRRFVWEPKRICDLFDSILQGYPIGTFLFWEIEDERRHEYAFYEFIREYSEHEDGCYNPTAERNLPPGVTGVLDGQQRLNSMLIALCGSYCQFIGGQGYHARRQSSYIEKWLHFCLNADNNEENETLIRFKFLTREEADPVNSRGQHRWFGEDLLEELLTVPIWDRRAYIVLALIHPQHAKHQHQFHKDHLHPHARFNYLTALDLDPEQEARWHDMKNRLPNVQLLQGTQNIVKQAKPLKIWIETEFSERRAREVFLEQNDIPNDLSLELRDFETFFTVRKESLRQRLRRLLNISVIESPAPALVDSN
jgi:hypothetical protein